VKFNIGAYIDKPGSSLKNKTGGWKDKKPVIDIEICKKCGVCWSLCPEGAIFKNKNGDFEVNLDYCKGCGICSFECPFKAIKMVDVK
jgi:pyruvate ferredoxin oxidoreductase delta subunit